MNILDVFSRVSGTELQLRMRADENVLAYGAFLIHLPSGNTTAEWPAGVLESGEGARASLDDPQGYAIVVAPIVRNGTTARFTTELRLGGSVAWDDPVAAPPKESFGWTIAISEG